MVLNAGMVASLAKLAVIGGAKYACQNAAKKVVRRHAR
jgi:hypothetical protein